MSLRSTSWPNWKVAYFSSVPGRHLVRQVELQDPEGKPGCDWFGVNHYARLVAALFPLTLVLAAAEATEVCCIQLLLNKRAFRLPKAQD